MKILVTLLLVLMAMNANAKDSKRITLECFGEVRFGSYFGDAVHVPFDIIVTEKLASRLVEVQNVKRYSDAEVSCDYIYNPNTFYKLQHLANMKLVIQMTKTQERVEKEFECAALVQDGGNQTLKKSCARKVAKIIREVLDLY